MNPVWIKLARKAFGVLRGSGVIGKAGTAAGKSFLNILRVGVTPAAITGVKAAGGELSACCNRLHRPILADFCVSSVRKNSILLDSIGVWRAATLPLAAVLGSIGLFVERRVRG